MDKVLHNLYIGGLEALDRIDDLAQAGITHILSILEFDYCDYEEYHGYQRLFIPAEDAESQDLLCYFSTTNEFIAKALGTSDNVVLVHCAMGQSRSAAIVCAYMMFTHHVSAEQALREVQLKRPMCAPNEGFMAQLQLFGQMLETRDGMVKATTGRDCTRCYTVLSNDADATRLPSGVNATSKTPTPWPSSSLTSAPVAASQSLTVLSADPNDASRPSGENATP
jgi:protein-tyrosine phosphatase